MHPQPDGNFKAEGEGKKAQGDLGLNKQKRLI